MEAILETILTVGVRILTLPAYAVYLMIKPVTFAQTINMGLTLVAIAAIFLVRGYRKDQLAKATIDTCGYLDVPHAPTITVAVQFPIALPLELTPENLIPFIEKTVRDYSGNTIDFIAIDNFNSDRKD